MKEIELRQVQSDSTAGLVYSKGVSIVHLSMIVGIFYVTRPDLAFGERYRETFPEDADACNEYASKMNFAINTCLISHLFCMVATFSAEIFETDLTNFGTMIRIGDVLATLVNASTAILSMGYFFGWYNAVYLNADGSRLVCFSHDHQQEFLGTTVSWLAIELIVWISFIFTMVLCLIKQVLNQPISADNSNMFGTRYMSYMANLLC